MVIVLAILLWFVLRPSPGSPTQNPALPATATQTAPGSASSSLTATGSAAMRIATRSSVSAGAAPIAFMTPTAGSQWIFQKQHTISWSRASGYPGSLVLLNASTGATVGWIEQQIGTAQDIFPWDTQNVFPSQTNPTKKDILPGNYRMELIFSSPTDRIVTGPVFSVIPAVSAVAPIENIGIQNHLFSPSAVTVAQGTQLMFSNLDPVAYQLSISSNGSLTIATSGAATFDTSHLFPGSYYIFYSTTYPSLRLTVTVTNSNS